MERPPVRTFAPPEEQGAEATRRASNRNGLEEMSRHRFAATFPPSGSTSIQATPNCLPAQPSIHREAAIGEALRRAPHRSDFMHHLAREEDDLVLLRNDRLIAAFADVQAVFQMRIVNAQLSTLEHPRLAVKEIDERQITG